MQVLLKVNSFRHELQGPCRLVLNALPDEIAIIDSSGTILHVNTAWEKFAGENNGNRLRTGIGVNYFQVCERSAQLGTVEASLFLEKIQAIFQGSIVQAEVEYPCHSPLEKRWFKAVCSRMEFDGKVFALVVHRNVTSRTHLQFRLAQLMNDFEEAKRNELRGEWYAHLAHQIKNPLTATLLQTQFLKRIILTEKVRDPRFAKICSFIQDRIQDSAELIEKLGVISYPQYTPLETIRVLDLLADLMVISKGWSALSGVQIEIEPIEEDLRIRGHRLPLSLALLDILNDYCFHAEKKVHLSAHGQDGQVLIEVLADGYTEGVNSSFYLKTAEKIITAEHGRLTKIKESSGEKIIIATPR